MSRALTLLTLLVAASAPLLMAPEGRPGCAGACVVQLRLKPGPLESTGASGTIDHQVQVKAGTRYFVEAWAPDAELDVELMPRGPSAALRELECATDRSFTYCEFVSTHRGTVDVLMDVSSTDTGVALTFGELD